MAKPYEGGQKYSYKYKDASPRYGTRGNYSNYRSRKHYGNTYLYERKNKGSGNELMDFSKPEKSSADIKRAYGSNMSFAGSIRRFRGDFKTGFNAVLVLFICLLLMLNTVRVSNGLGGYTFTDFFAYMSKWSVNINIGATPPPWDLPNWLDWLETIMDWAWTTTAWIVDLLANTVSFLIGLLQFLFAS